MAFPRITPSLTLTVRFGGVGGRGGVTVSTTAGEPAPQLTHPGVPGITDGGSTFRLDSLKGPVTDGTFDAMVPTPSGTRVGSFVGATPSVLSDTVILRSTGAFACFGR